MSYHEGMKGMKRQFSELSNQVIGCAIEVHRVLGNRTLPLAFGRPFNRMIQDRFILRVPVKLLALAISAGGHDDGYRMSITVAFGSFRLRRHPSQLVMWERSSSPMNVGGILSLPGKVTYFSARFTLGLSS